MNFDVIARAKEIVFDSDLDAVDKSLASLILEALSPEAEIDSIDKLINMHSDEQLQSASAAAEMAVYEAKRDREDFILVNGAASDIEMLNLEYENMQKQLEKTLTKIQEKFAEGSVEPSESDMPKQDEVLNEVTQNNID